MVLDSEEVGRTRFLGLGIDVWLDFENLLLVVVKEGLREGLYLRLRCGNKLECKNYEDLMRAGSVLLNIIILHHPPHPPTVEKITSIITAWASCTWPISPPRISSLLLFGGPSRWGSGCPPQW